VGVGWVGGGWGGGGGGGGGGCLAEDQTAWKELLLLCHGQPRNKEKRRVSINTGGGSEECLREGYTTGEEGVVCLFVCLAEDQRAMGIRQLM